MHVLLEDLLHVNLGCLGVQRKHTVHGVFLGSIASVRGDSLIDEIWSCLLELDGNLVLLEVSGVPGSVEIVTLVDQAVTAVNSHGRTALHVLRLVVVFLTERHAGAVGENGSLSESLSLQEHGEGVAATVLHGDLLDLNSVVGEEVV